MQNSMHDSLMPNYQRLPVCFERGDGCNLFDSKGEKYIDALSGIAVCGLGHAHPRLSAALSDQVSKLWHTSNLYRIELQEQLADRLASLSGLNSAFFCNSGAEANEAAIKLARKYAHDRGITKPVILSMEGSFHGRTLGALSATGNEKAHTGFYPLLAGFEHFEFGCTEEVERRAVDKNVIAVLVEPIQGEGGVVVPEKNYLKKLREICNVTDSLLMVDEVQTGIGRTGNWFAFQKDGIVPDVLSLAKGLGNGIPIGACLASEKLSSTFSSGAHGTTFGGNPLACRVALSVLDTILDEALLERAHSLGEFFITEFTKNLAGLKRVRDIRGQGLMIGIELDIPCGELVMMALKKHVLINVANTNTVRLLPPLIMADDEAKKVINTVSECVTEFLEKNS